MNGWMVRAGKDAIYINDFIAKKMVSLGWSEAPMASNWKNQGEYYRELLKVYPEWKARKVSISAGQIFRFYHEVCINDYVVTYAPLERTYWLGRITSDVKFDSGNSDFRHVRSVEWVNGKQRDDLSLGARNVLGAISTFFKLPEDTLSELIASNSVKPFDATSSLGDSLDVESENEAEKELLFEDLTARSLEFVKDAITELDWEEAQELVAGILRAMGFKTQISPSGPDRGKDIIASPDGFGFRDPRVVVEVKHRKGSMSAPEIRSFIGGRHADDKGLYVSTGGFTKEAYYEAERATIRLTLMNLDDLARALLTHYDQLDQETKQLVPLRKMYWPT